jgi:hypothetical protein
MRLVACALLAGCNQVLALDPTHTSGGPARCPPIGTPPLFAPVVGQEVEQYCTRYTLSATTGMAMASCLFGSGIPVPAYGPAGGPLDAIELATNDPADAIAFGPVLAPEGDEAYAVLSNTNTVGSLRLAVFALDGGQWTWRDYEPLGAGVVVTDLSPPTRRPGRHVVYYVNSQTHEARQDATGTWTDAGTPYDSFPVNANRPYLSPDGLRFASTVLEGDGFHVVYADRPTIDGRFGPPAELANVPPTVDTFLAEDCGRVYFSGLDNVLFEPQP